MSGGRMAQVTIYLDDDTLQRMRVAAASAGMSMSAWLAQLVAQRTQEAWPADVAARVGARADAPDTDAPRATVGVDVPRESL